MVDDALGSGALTLGPRTAELEASFAARHGVRHAVAVSSGTAALEIILRALGVEGGEVVVPANTFFATAAAVQHAGGRVRLADVDPSTMALSAEALEATVTERTVGVVLVHIGGLVTPAFEAVEAVCRRHGLFLVEDAAHAHGAAHAGRPAGSLADAAAFSFYPTKLTASGEGGVITTDDDHVRDEALLYRDQGKAGFQGGEHVRLGYAWRMSELHAAVGLVHLRRLDEHIAVRRWAASVYDEALRAIPGVSPLPVPTGSATNYYKYVALLDGIDRDALRGAMRRRGVGLSGEVYARPLNHEPVFAGLAAGPLPNAEEVCRRHVCLPVYSDMTDREASLVVDALEAAVDEVAGQPRRTA